MPIIVLLKGGLNTPTNDSNIFNKSTIANLMEINRIGGKFPNKTRQ